MIKIVANRNKAVLYKMMCLREWTKRMKSLEMLSAGRSTIACYEGRGWRVDWREEHRQVKSNIVLALPPKAQRLPGHLLTMARAASGSIQHTIQIATTLKRPASIIKVNRVNHNSQRRIFMQSIARLLLIAARRMPLLSKKLVQHLGSWCC